MSLVDHKKDIWDARIPTDQIRQCFTNWTRFYRTLRWIKTKSISYQSPISLRLPRINNNNNGFRLCFTAFANLCKHKSLLFSPIFFQKNHISSLISSNWSRNLWYQPMFIISRSSNVHDLVILLSSHVFFLSTPIFQLIFCSVMSNGPNSMVRCCWTKTLKVGFFEV